MLCLRLVLLVVASVVVLSCSTNYVYVVSGDNNKMPISQVDVKDGRLLKMSPGSIPVDDNTTLDKSKEAKESKRPVIYILIDQHKITSPSTTLDVPVRVIP
jgi:hypothetical protein